MAYCWGYADIRTNGEWRDLLPTDGGLGWTRLPSSHGRRVHTCGTTTGNKAYCWGYGYDGALGNGTTTDRFAPRAVSGTLSYSRVFASGSHTCGLTTGQKAYCWGTNSSGQLGDGTTTKRLAPVAVQTGRPVCSVGISGRPHVWRAGRHGCGLLLGEQRLWPGRRRHDHLTPPDAHASGRSAVGQTRRHACRGVPTMFREPFLGLPLPLDSSVCRS